MAWGYVVRSPGPIAYLIVRVLATEMKVVYEMADRWIDVVAGYYQKWQLVSERCTIVHRQ